MEKNRADEMNNLSTIFLKMIKETLLEIDWEVLLISNVDLSFKKNDQKTIVSTKQNMFFINAEEMDHIGIQEIVKQIHHGIKTQPPLFPATNQIIFFYQKSPMDDEWILSNGKKQDIAKSNYTVSWVIDLNKKKLYAHKGLPLIKSGKKEIESVLQQL